MTRARDGQLHLWAGWQEVSHLAASGLLGSCRSLGSKELSALLGGFLPLSQANLPGWVLHAGRWGPFLLQEWPLLLVHWGFPPPGACTSPVDKEPAAHGALPTHRYLLKQVPGAPAEFFPLLFLNL